MASAQQSPNGRVPAGIDSSELQEASRAPGMIVSAIVLLIAALSIVVPHLIEVAAWVRLLGLVVGLISDLTYVWVDPRIDFESRET